MVKSNGDLHLVFSSQDSVYYSKSTDNGLTFIKKYFIGIGHYPTIISDGEENIYLLWRRGDIFVFEKTFNKKQGEDGYRKVKNSKKQK